MTYVLKPDLLQKKFYEVFINTLPFFFPVKADSFGSIFCWNCNGQIYQRKIILAETAPHLVSFFLSLIVICSIREFFPDLNDIFFKEIGNILLYSVGNLILKIGKGLLSLRVIWK